LNNNTLYRYPRFIDIEASSLGKNSYPIEVAWSDVCGNIESHLINVYAVESWTDWDFYAQNEIHGISRKMCREEGVNPNWLCNRLSELMAPLEVIYSDGGNFDEFWIDELYGAGSQLGFAQFKIVHSDYAMLEVLNKSAYSDRKNTILGQLKKQARETVSERHRATPDVQYLIELYKLCVNISQEI